MSADLHFVRAAAAQLAAATDATCAALAEGLVGSERAFTDRLVRRMASELDGFTSHEMRWRAKAFVDRPAEEATYLADLLVAFEVDLPDYGVRSGILATVVRRGPQDAADHEALEALRRRCQLMLTATGDAFVLMARPSGVIVLPAATVAGSVGRLDRLHQRTLGRFFEEHFSSFIGDPRMAGEERVSIDELCRQHRARTGLALHVEPASMPHQESLFRR
ncbi:MAG: hypothetical protein R3244_00065 [Thermoanaerobaculia bacterium]|nr:hypothetical protein [Thermoanaerobaculia bacterium]